MKVLTRINLIKPGFLLDQHLIAEYREIPMVPAALIRTLDACAKRGVYDYKIPKRYTLNKGHVKFFYDKREFLENRYAIVMKELRRRGFILDPYRCVSFHYNDEVPPWHPTDKWMPDADEVDINLQRILQRVAERPKWYRYRGRIVTVNDYKAALRRRGLI